MRHLDRTRRARGAGRAGDALQVQCDDEPFALDVVEANICGGRKPPRPVSVHSRERHALEDRSLELVTQHPDARPLLRDALAGQRRRPAQAHDARGVLRSWPAVALVMAPVKERLQNRPLAYVERAHPLRPVQFVRGKREQIHAELFDVHGNFAHGLHGVRVEIDVALARHEADFLEGLDGPELVVRVHHGDEHSVGLDCPLEVGRVHNAVRTGPDVSHAHTALFELAGGVKHRVVLDVRGDDVLRGALRRFDNSKDGGVVGLRAAAGEDDFRGPSVNQVRQFFAGVFDSRLRSLAEPVNRAGVAVVLGEVGLHRLEDFRRQGRRGVVVQINSAHHYRLGPWADRSPDGAATPLLQRSQAWRRCQTAETAENFPLKCFNVR